jgi:CubicO group peptidase (beta-lactamase class C family)
MNTEYPISNINFNAKSLDQILEKGVADEVFPCAVLLVSCLGKEIYFNSKGVLSRLVGSVPVENDTIFDLASLTKPLATSLAMMRLVDNGSIGLDQPLGDILKTLPLNDKNDLTSRFLLSHCAGFPDWKPYYLELITHNLNSRKELLRKRIIAEPLEYRPGEAFKYSDPGFMILEWVIEEVSGMSMRRFLETNFYEPLGFERLFLSNEIYAGRYARRLFAPTENCPWRKKVLQGEVHDDNAYALGGYSGHAGLFGDARDVHKLVNFLREHYIGKRNDHFKPETIREFFKIQDIADNCTWALGWDTPSPEGSSSGNYFSSNSVGHLGFTGTSVWMDLEKDVIVILLTNRVHPTRENQKIKEFRPILHNVIMESLGKAG